MNCYNVNLNQLANILSWGKEHLIPPRVHISRKINCYILYVITEGELALIHNDRPLILKSGEAFIFAPGDTQKPLNKSECKYYYAHFNADITPFELEENAFISTISQKNLAFSNCKKYGEERYHNRKLILPEKFAFNEKVDFNYITNKFEQNINVFHRFTIDANLSLSIDFLKVLIKLEDVGKKTYGGKKSDYVLYSTVNKIAEFLNHHYLEDITGEVIEQEFIINFDYANHLFKSAMGESIIKYRNSLRIERAKFLLITTDTRIEQIALESGFSDKFYFTRYFTKRTGISPTRFREAERGNV